MTILPVVMLVSIVTLVVFIIVFLRCFKCVRRCLMTSSIFQKLDRCCGNLVGRLLLLSTQAAIWIPKFKILIAMTQVQNGLVPTFQITLPEMFADLLEALSFYQFDVPLDCIFSVSFHM